ncbi:MAG: hypothetical protein KAS86_05525, partial [Candidatus Omnitrophica bacterium]|nr:hypothetical protein [Candidatus Omnitrophota bacterium]
MSDRINRNGTQEPRIPYAADPLAYYRTDPEPKVAKKKKATKTARRSVLKGSLSSSKKLSSKDGFLGNALNSLGYQAGYLRNGKFKIRKNNASYKKHLYGSSLKA